MKVQFRSILFALVLPAAVACGGDRETSSSTAVQSTSPSSQPMSDVRTHDDTPAASAVAAQPKSVAVKAQLAVPTKYDEALANGRALLAKGSYGDAKQMLEAAIALDGKKAEPHIEMARLYIALGQRGNSIAAAKRAIKLAPLSSQAWNTKGRAELNAHNYDNAIEAFSHAVELNQDNVFAWNNLGYTELLLERYADAAEHLTEATSHTGATGYMFNNLGTALEHLDRLDEARLAYEAGGKLGSPSAVASRKRLEGVKSIAIAAVAATPTKASTSGVHEYDLTEGDDLEEPVLTDEDQAMEPDADKAMEPAADNAMESDDDEAMEPDASQTDELAAEPIDGAVE